MTISSSRKTFLFSASAALLIAAAALAADGLQPPLINWTAPATWSPQGVHRGVSTMGDITNPVPFIGVTPCRQYDSRAATPLANVTNRTVTITGAPCGIPSTAVAISLNITIFNITGATGNGVFLVGTSGTPTTAWINYPPSETQRGNAGALPLPLVVRVEQGGGSVDFTVDVNGYYYDGTSLLTAGEQFRILANVGSAAAIYGHNSNGGGYGVWGDDASGIGVLGTSTGYNGVWAQALNWDALAAFGGRDGGYLQGARNGAVGVTVATTGTVYGLVGVTGSPTNNAAGVLGVGGTGASAGGGVAGSPGVLGTAKTAPGVTGISQTRGVIGLLFDSSGSFLAEGDLATHAGTVNTYGVYSFGDYGGTGNKYFVEPHPTDATKIIRYVALEGPESGTYFRGSSRTLRGQAVIEVPESFRMVTDDEGLTVHVTPIGELATVAVVSKDLDRIVVRSSKDIAFDYLVHGVRRAFKNFQPISDGGEFMPRSPDEPMPAYLTEEAKRRLIANGTYNADGTVNMETAERAGWTKIWADRKAEAEAAARAAAQERSQTRESNRP